MKLQHKVSLVTGAGSGIGRATVQLLAREGAKVIAVDINSKEVQKTQTLVEQEGGICHALIVDVSQEQQVKEAIATTIDMFGSIDILHNNAGISVLKLVTETTAIELDKILGVNLKGVFFGCKHAIPQMVKQGGGVIINTVSELGIVAQPLYSAYCASKGGVLALTRALSVEWAAKGIRINAICPGPVDTPMLQAEFEIASNPKAEKMAAIQSIPAGRLATPEDIAQVALFLASDSARFVHGASIVVDGGKTIF